MSSPSKSASVNCNDKWKSKNWHYRTHNTDLLNLEENKFDYKKNCPWKKKFSQNLESEICTKWDKLQRAQEQRVDEVSVQKSRENHETIQQLTAQLQQMQEQMHSMIDSGDFQDVESNKSGRLSHVSSQPAMIPSSRSLLSRDKKTAAWHMQSIWITGKRFWKSIFYVWFTQRSSSKNSIWRRAKKLRSSPWSWKDED